MKEQGKDFGEIYDIKGKLISSIIDSDDMNIGTYKVTWDGKNNAGVEVTSGVYLAKLTTGNFMKSIRLNFVK